MKLLKGTRKRILAMLLVLATCLSMQSGTVAFAATATTHDGLGCVLSKTTVYQNSNLTTAIGSVYAYETFTILDWSYNSNMDKICHIEYSTSSGSKTGYVLTNAEDTTYTCVATVSSNATVYYGL